MCRKLFLIMVCWLAAFLAVDGPVSAAELLDMEVNPASLQVNAFFTGGQVAVSGRIPAQADAVVEITGPVVKEVYDLKGRVGPFWMTKQTIHLENAPSLYALLSPAGDQWERLLPELGLGFDRLKTGLHLSHTESPGDEILTMFMDLKKSEGLYVGKEGAVTYGEEKDGFRSFKGVFDFPSATIIGDYTVKVTVIEDGAMEGAFIKELPVREIGFVKLIDDLSKNRRLTYGIFAVLIALFTGGIMGFLFKGGGSH